MILLICLCYAILGGLAIAVGYHRLLAHHAFRCPKWIEYPLIAMGLPTGHPVQWVAVHRLHHAFSDREGDPHSIHVQGFWYAQVGKYIGSSNPWLCLLYSLSGPLRIVINGWLSPRMDRDRYHMARDVKADPVYAWLTRPVPYMLCSLIHLSVTFGPMGWFFGWEGVGWLSLTVLVVFNVGDAGDTVAHLWGTRLANQKHRATNLWWYALLSMGDGWHANHHSFPQSAKHGFMWWQLDGAYRFIQLLETLRLARDVKVPFPEDVARVYGRQEHDSAA